MNASNLKLEDITAIALVSNENGMYGKTPYTYTFKAPYVWAQYEGNDWSSGINNKSKAYSLTTNTTTYSVDIRPYDVVWNNYNMNTTSAYENPKYKALVTDPIGRGDYWISTRFVQPNFRRQLQFWITDCIS